jgi:hypothetical protein
MPTHWTHWSDLIGGVRGAAQLDLAFPPASYRVPASASTLPRSAYPPLSTPQYQANAGSCLPHAYAGCIEADVAARLGPGSVVQLCRLDLYFGARYLAGDGLADVGSYPDHAARWLRDYGTVPEVLRPYDADLVTTWRPPTQWVPRRRLLTADLPQMPPDIRAIKAELAAGRVVPVCHNVDRQMEQEAATTGIEKGMTGASLGGHCRNVCGFDDDVSIPGFPPGIFDVWNWWRRWGKPHPKAAVDSRFAPFTDSFSRIPQVVLVDPRWSFDFRRLARGLDVEA